MRRAAVALLLAAGCQTRLQATEPSLQVSAKSLDFGTLPVLNTKTLTLTLTDVGEADLTVKSIAVSPDAGAFALQGSPPISVAGGGGSQTVTLAFTPPAEESYQGTLTIVSDDPTNGNLAIPLTGVGSTEGQISVSPDPVDFGQVGQGDTALQTLTISSVGTAPLLITGLSLDPTGDPAFGFASSAKANVTLAPGSSVPLALRFSPGAQTPTSAKGAVIVTSTDPNQPSLSVPLTGQAIQAPVCAIADPGTVPVGSQVTLDATGSYDPGGHTPLVYQWAMTSKPAGSAAVLANLQGPQPQFVADQPGGYAFSLSLTNALGVSSVQPCTATLVARPADDLYVEMIWDNLPVDMDLHFLAPGGLVGSAALDCNGNNQNPTGFAATCSDDHLTGPGPEWAEDANPAAGTYTIDVIYFSTHGVSTPDTNVTVRVYEYGVVIGVFTQQLTTAGQLWQVATVDWPSGTLTTLGTVSG